MHRRRRHVVGGLAALVILVGALLVADAGDPGGSTGAAPVAERPVDAGAAGFGDRVDSLTAALSRFRERRRDFELGRIDCEGLTRGFREVRAAFGRLERASESDGASASERARLHRDRLTTDVRDAERAYDASGCAAAP